MLRSSTVFALITGCIFWTIAQACEITDAKPAKLGVDKGVRGKCPSGFRVTCVYAEGEGWSCDGPEGSYSGASTMEAAVRPACGCREYESYQLR